eukprot:366498-Chlamydomonas_euryale.AAC.5
MQYMCDTSFLSSPVEVWRCLRPAHAPGEIVRAPWGGLRACPPSPSLAMLAGHILVVARVNILTLAVAVPAETTGPSGPRDGGCCASTHQRS